MEQKEEIQFDRDLSKPEIKMTKRKKNSKKEINVLPNDTAEQPLQNQPSVINDKPNDEIIDNTPIEQVPQTPVKEDKTPSKKEEIPNTIEPEQGQNVSNLDSPDRTVSYINKSERAFSDNNIKEEFHLREIEYKEKIKQLEDELHIERNKATEKQKISSEDIVNGIKKELKQKENDINKYITLNTKQRNELERLSKEIDKKLKTMTFKHVTDRIKKERKPKKEEDPDAAITIVENQLKNALQLVDILTKDNQMLKDKCAKALDYNSRYELADKAKESDNTITALNMEIKQLKRKLEEHSKCGKIKNEYEKNIRITREDLRKAKLRNEEMKTKIKIEEELYNTNKNKKEVSKPKKLINGKISLRKKSPKREEIPPKENQNIINGKGYFTKKEQDYLLEAFDKDSDELDKFYKRISIFNSYTQSLESKQRIEMKAYLSKLNDLDEKIEYLTQKNKDTDTKNHLLQTQINDYKSDKNAYIRKIDEVNKSISAMSIVIKQKETEIKSLSDQLTQLRDMLRNGNVNKVNIEISNYISEVKADCKEQIIQAEPVLLTEQGVQMTNETKPTVKENIVHVREESKEVTVK